MPGWQSVASVTATASGSTDGLSGLDHYEYEISADGGTTWGAATAGDTTDVTDEGRTSLRFRAVDAAGNASAWMSGDAWLDRTPPSDPSLAGGSSAWLSQASESRDRERLGRRRLGPRPLRVRDLHRRRLDLVGAHRRLLARRLGRG